MTVEVKVRSTSVITTNGCIVAGIAGSEAVKSLRRFPPFCLFVGISLTGRLGCRGLTWVLYRRVEFLNSRGKRGLSFCLSIIEVIVTGDIEQNDTGYDANRDNERTTALLKPVLRFFVEPDHGVVPVLHLLDGDLLLSSCCFRQNSEPPKSRQQNSVSDKVHQVGFRGCRREKCT